MALDFSSGRSAHAPSLGPMSIAAASAPTETWMVSDYPATQTSRLRWSPDNVIWHTDGTFDLVLAAAPGGSDRPFVSGEVATTATAMTGTWEWTLQAPDMVSGSVLGMFLFQADPHAPRVEYDFEFVGDDTTQIELNVHMQNAAGQNVMLEGGPRTVDLGFDGANGQHTYTIEVTGTSATFLADGRELATLSADDMVGNAWRVTDMRAYVDLWPVSPGGQEYWAGAWSYPGSPMVAKVTDMGMVGGGGSGGGGLPPSGLIGNDLANILAGTIGNDLMEGRGGNDALTGSAGDDTLSGGTGDDRLSGGDGNDVLFMDAGNDQIDGGAGIDWLALAGSVGIRISMTGNSRDATTGSDRISNVENVVGGAGADTITGNRFGNVLLGANGDDLLSGSGGNDILDGGFGRDRLTGGQGADTFLFRSTADSRFAAADTIADFRSGQDKIDLSDLSDHALTAGSAAAAYGVWFEGVGRNAHLLADTGGDGVADFEILFASNARFTASDLIL